MSKLNSKSLADAVAASAGSLPVNRFTAAASVLSKQPTGFTAASEESPVADSPQTMQSLASPEEGESYRVVPVDQILDNPFNARRVYLESRIQEMAISLASHGQEVPGTATIRDGKIVLAAGHYRLKGLKFAGLPEMKLLVRPGMTDQELYRVSFIENDERTGQSVIDNAIAWKTLLDEGVFSSETHLSEVTKKSLPTVNKTLTILNLSVVVLDLVKSDPTVFGMSILYELLQLERVAGQQVTYETACLIQKGEASRRTIQELRERYEHPTQRKKKESSRQNYRILVDSTDVGFIREFDEGRVVLDLVLHDPVKRSDLIRQLKERFGIDPST